MATEETKPVEREAFDEWFCEEFEELNPLGQEARAFRIPWDAALERAARLEPNEAMVPQDGESAHIYRVGFVDCLNAILALKGRE